MQQRQIDAVVTVGTGGDKMFWGRLAGWLAGVPVICSALHSTGLPDHVELLNRLLSPLTDAFIAVAESHGCYLAAHEGCPAKKIRVIPNGIDVERFHPRWPDRLAATRTGPGSGRARGGHRGGAPAREESRVVPEGRRAGACQVAGGPVPGGRRRSAAGRTGSNGRESRYRSRPCDFWARARDVPELLSLMDVLVLTSDMEANPICVLEAMASEKPVVATRVGSLPETVLDGRTGYLAPAGNCASPGRSGAGTDEQPRPGGKLRPGGPRTRHRPLVGRPHGPRLSRPVGPHLHG